jgi:hypothetical protein
LIGRRKRQVPLNKPETERIIRNKGNLRQDMKKVGDLCLRRALARLPSASSAARRLLLLPATVLGTALVIGKRKLEVGKDLKAKGLVKSWGHPRFYL